MIDSDSPERALTIGQVAKRAGLRTSSIRYYESVGVLPEPERLSGQRRYSAEILDRLSFIDVAQEAGFSLEEIRELLDGAEHGQASQRLTALAERKLGEVEALISQATMMRGWLQAAQACECRSLDVCALFSDSAVDALRQGLAGGGSLRVGTGSSPQLGQPSDVL